MLLEKLKDTIRRNGLITPGDSILIASSGGPDSTALMFLLLELQKEWPLTLALGHFNHKLRPEADRDERFVRETAQKLGLPFYSASRDVSAFAKTERLNIEEAGRRLRYGFLGETARSRGFSKIATGHTLDDQTETFFMRLFRGSGLSGLCGIYPVVDGIVVRPLLGMTREEILRYLDGIGAEFHVDDTNSDMRFLRNRIRCELLPYIRDSFDPNLLRRIGQVVSLIQDDEGVLEGLAAESAQKALSGHGRTASLDFRVLSELPLGLARRVVRVFVAEVRGDLREISFEDIRSILNLKEGKRYPLRKDCVLFREKDRVFCRAFDVKSPSFEFLWEGNVTLTIEEAGFHISGRVLSRLPEGWTHDDRTGACLDREKLAFPLLVRNRLPGDRYRPLGSPGRKKIKEIMRAKGVPFDERNKRPVFLSEGEIVWIPGLPVSEHFKIGSGTQKIFNISLDRIASDPSV